MCWINMGVYGTIYMVVNLINNKRYVGQTTNSFHYRYQGNFPKNCSNNHIKNAINKYGWSNFEVIEELDVAYSKKELDEKECYYIEKYQTTDSRYGYNKKTGGANGKMCDETRRKLSESHKGRFKGEDNPFYGRKHTEETRMKISKAQLGKKGAKNGRSKEVICLNTMKRYESANIASAEMGLSHSSVTDVCSGKMSQTGGYSFMFYEDYLRRGVWVKPKIKNTGRKKVYCKELDAIFESATQCATTLNLDRSAISKVCKGERKSVGGYTFKYA